MSNLEAANQIGERTILVINSGFLSEALSKVRGLQLESMTAWPWNVAVGMTG